MDRYINSFLIEEPLTAFSKGWHGLQMQAYVVLKKQTTEKETIAVWPISRELVLCTKSVARYTVKILNKNCYRNQRKGKTL